MSDSIVFPGQNIGSRPAGINECFYSHGNDPCPSGFKCMNSTNVCVKSEHCLTQWGGDHGQSYCYHNCYYDSKGCFDKRESRKQKQEKISMIFAASSVESLKTLKTLKKMILVRK